MTQDGSNGGGVARGAGIAAGKTAILVGIAVIIGVVLLQVVDDGSDGPVSEGTEAPTTAEPDGDGGTAPPTTTEPDTPTITPDQLKVLVLNGGAPAGSAGTMSDTLEGQGYGNQADPADWSGKDQTGNAVMCQAGLDREAQALASAVGEGTTVEAWPDPPPPGAEGAAAQCVVVVGATA